MSEILTAELKTNILDANFNSRNTTKTFNKVSSTTTSGYVKLEGTRKYTNIADGGFWPIDDNFIVNNISDVWTEIDALYCKHEEFDLLTINDNISNLKMFFDVSLSEANEDPNNIDYFSIIQKHLYLIEDNHFDAVLNAIKNGETLTEGGILFKPGTNPYGGYSYSIQFNEDIYLNPYSYLHDVGCAVIEYLRKTDYTSALQLLKEGNSAEVEGLLALYDPEKTAAIVQTDFNDPNTTNEVSIDNENKVIDLSKCTSLDYGNLTITAFMNSNTNDLVIDYNQRNIALSASIKDQFIIKDFFTEDRSDFTVKTIDFNNQEIYKNIREVFQCFINNVSSSTVSGTFLNDTIQDYKGASTIHAGAGDDIIYGFNGNDKLYGDEGNNTFVFGFDLYYDNKNKSVYSTHTHGNDKIYSGTGDDKISFNYGDPNHNMISLDDIDVEKKNNGLIIYYGNKKGSIELVDYYKLLNDGEQHSVKTIELYNPDFDNDYSKRMITYSKEELIKFCEKKTLRGSVNGPELIGGYKADNLIGDAEINNITGDKGNDIITCAKGECNLFYSTTETFGDDTVTLKTGVETINIYFNTESENENFEIEYTKGKNSKDLLITTPKGTITIKDILSKTFNGTTITVYNNFSVKNILTEQVLKEINAENYFEKPEQKMVATYTGTILADRVDASLLSKPTKVAKKAKIGVTINTGAGDDIIFGSNYNDTIYSGTGEDTIQAGEGDDKIYLGKGKDTVTFLGDGNDIIYNSDIEDVLEISAPISRLDNSEYRYDTFIKSGNNLVIQYTDNDSITLANYFKQKEGTALDNINNSFSIANDAIIKTSNGTYLNDYIVGTSKANTIKAGKGNDIIIGGKGNDKLYSGEGYNEFIFDLGDGKDTVYLTKNSTNNLVFDKANYDNTTYTRKGYDLIINSTKTTETDAVHIKVGNKVYDISGLEGSATKLKGYTKIGTLYYKNSELKSEAAVYNDSITVKNYFKNLENCELQINGTEFSDYMNMTNTTLVYKGTSSKANKINFSDTSYNWEVSGGKKNDTIILGEGNDIIHEIGGNNTIDLGSGNNTLELKNAGGTITSGSGDDTYNITGLNKNIIISDNGGLDVLNITTLKADGSENLTFFFDVDASGNSSDLYVYNKANIDKISKHKKTTGYIQIKDYFEDGKIEQITVNGSDINDFDNWISSVTTEVQQWLEGTSYNSVMDVINTGKQPEIAELLELYTYTNPQSN